MPETVRQPENATHRPGESHEEELQRYVDRLVDGWPAIPQELRDVLTEMLRDPGSL